MKHALFWICLLLPLAGCAHTAAPGADREPQALPGGDAAGGPDVLLGTFEPRAEKEAEEAAAEEPPPAEAPPRAEAEDELDERTETEDSIVSTVEPGERKAGTLEVAEPEELDTREEREDPILSVLEPAEEEPGKECEEGEEGCEPEQQKSPEEDEPPG